MIELESSEDQSCIIDLDTDQYFNFLVYLKNNLQSAIDKSQLDIYLMALNKRIPKEWESFLKEFKFSNDPDYQTYLQLKNKFEK